MLIPLFFLVADKVNFSPTSLRSLKKLTLHIYRIYDPSVGDRYSTVKTTLTIFSIISLLLLLMTFVVSGLCFANFGRGLKESSQSPCLLPVMNARTHSDLWAYSCQYLRTLSAENQEEDTTYRELKTERRSLRPLEARLRVVEGCHSIRPVSAGVGPNPSLYL